MALNLRLLIFIGCALLPSLCAGAEPPEKALAGAIAQLDDSDPAVCDSAEAMLFKAGTAAIPELKQAALKGGLEQRYRSVRVLERFALDTDEPAAAREALEAVAGGKDKALALRASRIIEYPAVLDVMRRLVEGFDVYFTRDGELERALPIERPLLRFGDDRLVGSEGTMWGYGREGRPKVLLCVFGNPSRTGAREWMSDAVTLADEVVEVGDVDGNEVARWSPRESGLSWKAFPKAPPPAKAADDRLVQARKLAGRMAARQFSQQGVQPYDLALLSEPVLRYSDADAGIVDGAMFCFAKGRDPELALLVEVRSTQGKEEWQYALVRLTAAPMFAEIDDQQVWESPTPKDFMSGGKNPYWVLRRQLAE
jgi:hypothetical protein